MKPLFVSFLLFVLFTSAGGLFGRTKRFVRVFANVMEFSRSCVRPYRVIRW